MHDVAVVGAGPAGCVAARDLARLGARVALIDASHPREKPCGGGVTGRAMSFLGSPGRLDGHAIVRAVFEADGRAARVEIDDPDTLKIVDRQSFDAALLEEARDAGAEHIPQRVLACERRRDGWLLPTTGEPVRAEWLLGADGACGITRKRVARPFMRGELSIASGSFVNVRGVREVVIAFTAAPRGYLWSFPRRDHLAVGACAQADETTPAELHASADAWIDAYPSAEGHARRRYSWPIPSVPPRSLSGQPLAGDRWLLLGDAAGLVDPITREGIYFALESGAAAARALGTPDAVRAYRAYIGDGIHPELRRAAALKDAFFRPRFTRLLIDALESSAAVRAVMLDLVAGRQPYATLKRRLLGTLEFGLMARAWFYRTK